MNYINRLVLVLLLLISTKLYSQDTIPGDPKLLLDAYNNGVSKLAEAYLNAYFVIEVDTSISPSNGAKVNIPGKAKLIQNLVDTIHSKFTVVTLENISILRESLEIVERTLYENLSTIPSPKSEFAAESFKFASALIIDKEVYEYQAKHSGTGEAILPPWVVTWVPLLIIVSSIIGLGLLLFIRYENQKNLKQLAALVITTSISGDLPSVQKN